MLNIRILNKISPYGLNEFPTDMYHLSDNVEAPDAILLRSHQLDGSEIASSVKAIGRAGAGVNNIPIDYCTLHGIPVFNTPGANANAVTELVIAGMLLASRHICSAYDYVKSLQQDGEGLEKEIEQNKKKFAGFELLGKTLGVIGLGSVGVKVSNAAINLGMKVIGYDPTISVNRAWELSSQAKQANTLEDLLKHADFISLHVPLMESTKNLIDHERLQIIRKNAVVLNFSREGIVNNAAILSAINSQNLFMYINDFPSAELKNHPQVISLPHLGASTKEAEDNCAFMIVKQIRDFLENGSINNAVNFPNVDAATLMNSTRLIIINKNIPNMVAQISAKLAENKINIANLVNKSKQNIAYTLLDLDEKITPAILSCIKEIDGVISLRCIGRS